MRVKVEERISLQINKIRVGGELITKIKLDFPKVVVIIPVKDDKIILVRQYRYPIDKEILELPAGKVKKGESLLNAAKRELLEETGFVARKWRKLGKFYPTPGYSSEEQHFFLATSLKFRGSKREKGELIRKVEAIELEKLVEMVKRNEIKDGKTVIGVLLYSLILDSPSIFST